MAFSSFNSIQTFIRYVSTSVTNLFNFPSVDPSLVLYYPFDVSQNSVKTANYASGTAVYDATFTGSNILTTTSNTFVTGLGDLSLNNTMGSNIATNYVVSENTFDLAPSSGLSISFWIACNGVANTTGTIVSLPFNNAGAKLEIDISGTNMIYSNVTFTLYNYNTASNCTCCYSMRWIIYSYNGPIINLTRSSDNTSSDFYADPSQNYFTTGYNNTGISYSTWVGSSIGYVNIWYDQTGRGNHAIQNTAGNRPQIITQNGKYVINFLNNGTTSITYLNLTTPIRPNTIFTHFYPISQNITTLVQTSVDYGFRLIGSPTGNLNTATGGDWYYTSSINSGGTQLAYVNNTSSTNVNLDAWTTVSVSIQNPYWGVYYFQYIAYDQIAERGLNGYMSEMIFHNTTMQVTDMQNFYTNRLF